MRECILALHLLLAGGNVTAIHFIVFCWLPGASTSPPKTLEDPK